MTVELSTLGSVIKTAYEGEADTNAFDDAAVAKLAGIETAADVTDLANVTTALGNAGSATVDAADFVYVLDVSASPQALKYVTTQSIANLRAWQPSDITALAQITAAGTDYALVLDTSASPQALKKALVSDFGSFSITDITGQASATVAGDDELVIADATTSPATLKKATAQSIANLAAPEGTAILSTGEVGGTKFLREDGDGTCSWAVPAGSGDVSKVGTPVNNQLGVWTGDGTIEGDANLTWDGSTLAVTGAVTVTGNVDGRDVSTDGTKLDGISSGADVTAAALAAAGAITVAGTDEVYVLDVSASPQVLGQTTAQAVANLAKPTESLVIAVSDETTALTTGTAKVTFRMPYAFTLTAVRASVTTAPVGSTIIVDINEITGSPETPTSIFSTLLTIDAGERTSTTAAAAFGFAGSPAPATVALSDDAEITIDIDQVGSSTPGAGLKVYLIGTRT